MERTAEIENEGEDTGSTCSHSFNPEPFPWNLAENNRIGRFLPCHYFDYIGGTSTGA